MVFAFRMLTELVGMTTNLLEQLLQLIGLLIEMIIAILIALLNGRTIAIAL
jgi:hypothetical protein